MSLLSIIVPVYKVEQYLSECVESLLAQTFTDIEIILVDDGSPDNCPAICDEFAKKDNRVTVIHKANGGVSAARNDGLQAAQGKYVMFCDGDDYVHPDWCKRFVETAEKNPNSWIFCNIFKVSDTEIKTAISDPQEIKDIVSKPTYYKAFKKYISGNCWNKIYRLDVLKDNQICFDKNKRMCEDACFDAQYVQRCEKVIFIEEPLYYYRDNANSATHKFQPDLIESHLSAFALRRLLVSDEELPMLCDDYLNMFLQYFKQTFCKENKKGFFGKMRYNHKMFKHEEFKICVANATGKNDSALFMKALKTHNYYLFWSFQKLFQIKAAIFKRPAR